MEAAYVGVKLWAKAVQKSGSEATAEVRHAIGELRIAAPEGLMHVDPATQHTFKTPRIGRVTTDGQFEIVRSDVRPLAPVPFPPSRTHEAWQKLLEDLYTGWGNQWAAPSR